MGPFRVPILGFLLACVLIQGASCSRSQASIDGAIAGQWNMYIYYPGANPNGAPDIIGSATFTNIVDNVYGGPCNELDGDHPCSITGFYSQYTGVYSGGWYCTNCGPSSTPLSGSFQANVTDSGIEGPTFTYGANALGYCKFTKSQIEASTV